MCRAAWKFFPKGAMASPKEGDIKSYPFVVLGPYKEHSFLLSSGCEQRPSAAGAVSEDQSGQWHQYHLLTSQQTGQ